MLKKFTYALMLVSVLVIVFSFKGTFSSQPPSNVSGAPGAGLCTNCHGGAANSGGGGVVIIGLPSSFQAGQTYPLSVTITHGTADRTRWGFEINARNASNAGVGSFTAGPNTATISGPSEIGHQSAVFTAASNSYTYTGMSWVAPAIINAGDNLVTFYVAGNAANGDGSSSGDFIYSNTTPFTLPIELKNLDYKIEDGHKVRIDWKTSTEANSKEFIVEKSDDGNRFYEAGRVKAAGNSTEEKRYSFTDAKPSFFNQPVYYRLKLVDQDEKFKFSKIFQVVLKGNTTYLYSLSPNPASNYIMAGITSDKTEQGLATIISVTGNTLTNQTLQLQKGNGNYKISIESLPKGMYFLRFGKKDTVQTIGFVVL